MFGIILTPRRPPGPDTHADPGPIRLFPRGETAGPGDLERPGAGTSARPQELRVFAPGPRKARKADVDRAHRLLAAELICIAHPSFDDPAARDAILADPPRPDPAPAGDDRLPSPEREAHTFRKMNYLKYLAGRIRDRIDPDAPDRADLDEVERLQLEAVALKNQVVETHLRLVIAFARKRVTAGCDLNERISDGTFALMQAVDRFDFARGNRFSTYATWAIRNAFTQHDRREGRRHNRTISLTPESLAATDDAIERYEEQQDRDCRQAAVERLLGRLDRRERRIVVSRNGIGGAPERTLRQLGLDLGISKERVRQLEERAHAKLRNFARLEAIGPSIL